MSNKKIIYYGSCWPTNIGNSFVNLGAIYSLKAAVENDGEVNHFGGMSSYLFSINGRPDNCLSLGSIRDCDYVVIAGMIMCEELFLTQGKLLHSFVENGSKIIIAGGGASLYDDNEVKKVREWMKKIPIYGFISRDEYSYEKYGDLAEHSYNGIDSAIFVSDYFKSPKLNIPEYIIMNFDSNPEPKIDNQDRIVIRTHHSCWPTWLVPDYFKSPNTMISDLPTDYLMLYANTYATYSDRVHACLATLSYGNKAMFYGKNNPRLRMFERLGVPDIIKYPVSLDMVKLEQEKKDQIKFIKTIIGS